jgi:hypothetical protein
MLLNVGRILPAGNWRNRQVFRPLEKLGWKTSISMINLPLMSPRSTVLAFLWLVSSGLSWAQSPDASALAASFANPPDSARPWVYWTWIDGNITKEGITADLEAMKRVGIGGALILDVDQGAPHGPVKFFDAQWQDLFRHAISEANRLGMEINVNDGPGYYGSGGPWVPHDKAMQTVVQSETHIAGGNSWSGTLPRPTQAQEYRDIAVLAIPEAQRSRYQIPDFIMKALQWKAWVAYRGTQSAPLDATAPADAIIPFDRVVDLTSRMSPDGSLNWDAPAGPRTIIRFGHAWNGHIVGPSPRGESGPETDKLDKSATDLHFKAFVDRLNQIAGPEGKGALVATHIDSWEGGGQDWTETMRDEFKKRRGYDPVPYLPILTGRVLGDLQFTERFLFDLRMTVSELMIENYSAEYQRLANAAGLRNTFESYTTIANDLDNAEYVDEPMAEFWTPNGQGMDFHPTIKSMSSAAHINGYSVVGAESFTSGSREKFLWTPAMIKSIGDDAFAGGVNRFVFHRYAAQPFLNPKPGMQMGPWGLHYERTNTWWEFSGPWHRYLARCQYLLRQGTFVGDVLKLESEEPLHRFQMIPLTGFDYDACGPATFLKGSARGGRFAFPSGASYRLIVLPSTPTMSVGLLTRIRDLVQAGAAILGEPPQRTPGLGDYPNADKKLTALCDEIWGSDPSVTSRALGKGRVFRGMRPEQALAALGVSPDFTSDAGLKYIHRTVNGADVYFLSHAGADEILATCTFRTAGKQPELWNPETGGIAPLPAYSSTGGTTSISIPFQANGSAFVVFEKPADPASRIVNIEQNDVAIMTNGLFTPVPVGATPAMDLAKGEASESGPYQITTADGRTRRFNVAGSPNTVPLTGPWVLKFPAGWGAPPQVQLDNLISWSLSPDNGVKYFSGTATYSKTIPLPSLVAGQHIYLNLGRVQVMARVRLNGKDLGILWKPPFNIDITSAARAGDNALEIDVVNLWINRLVGDEQLPEDSARNTNGTLKYWPQWLLDGQASPTGRFTFSSWRLWGKDAPLQESGLIGPVTLSTTRAIPPQ